MPPPPSRKAWARVGLRRRADRVTSAPGYGRLVLAPLLAQRRSLAQIVAALLAMATAQSLFLFTIKGFLKLLFGSADLTGTVVLNDLIPGSARAWAGWLPAVSIERAHLPMIVPAAIIVAGLLNAFAGFVYDLGQQHLALSLARDLRERLFRGIIRQPYADIRKRAVGEWMSVVMNDVMFLQSRFSDTVGGVLKGGASVLAGLATMLYIHWQTGLVLLALSPFIAWAMGRTGRRISRFAEAYQRELGRLSAAILDLRNRFDFIRAQGGEAREKEHFGAVNAAYFRMVRRSIMVRSAFAPVMELLGFVLFALLVAGVGSGRWGAGMTPDVMMVFFGALGLLLRPLRDIGEQVSRFEETRGAFRDSLKLLERLESADESAQAPAFDRSAPFLGLEIGRLDAGLGGAVRFSARDVRVAPGRAVAVIGPSGAGKSTLLKTLGGLVPPLVWEAPRSWSETAAATSMVSQEPFLFDDTLEANLRYGLGPDEQPGPAALAAALATVNVAAEVEALPQGLATKVRAIGSNLSGGQLQRLCIARGILRERPLWLLDEATSAVDPRSEREITQRLVAAARAQGKVLISVTHRLQFLTEYDEVWFVEDGALRLRGPHAALLAEPRYRRYCAEAGEPDDA